MRGENSALFMGSVAAAAALGAAGMYLVQESKKNKMYQVPSQLLKSPYGKEIQMALDVALKGKSLNIFL